MTKTAGMHSVTDMLVPEQYFGGEAIRTAWTRWLVLMVLLGTGSLLNSCDGSHNPLDNQNQPVLRVLTWVDYISPNLIRDFEKQYNCRVVLVFIRSNEELHKELLKNPAPIDVVVPSSYAVPRLTESGDVLLRKLSPSLRNRTGVIAKHPGGIEELADAALTDMGGYAVPYLCGFTGLVFDTEVFKGDESGPSWSWVTEDPGKASLLNDHAEVYAAAMMSLGYAPNSLDEDEHKAGIERLHAWFKGKAIREDDRYLDEIRKGNRRVAMAYEGDVASIVNKEQEGLGFGLPREGVILSVECMAVTTMSSYPGLAEAFIGFMTGGEGLDKNAVWTGFHSLKEVAVERDSQQLTIHVLHKLPPCITKDLDVLFAQTPGGNLPDDMGKSHDCAGIGDESHRIPAGE